MKQALVTALILAYPNFKKEFLLLTDTSKVGIRAVLFQLDDQEKEHSIAFDSKTLSKHEQNYNTTNLEALAIIRALKKFKQYLHRMKFRIITNHKALK